MELLQKEFLLYTLFLVFGFYIIFHCVLFVWKKGVTTTSFLGRIIATLPLIIIPIQVSDVPITKHDYIFLLLPFVLSLFYIFYKYNRSYAVRLVRYDYKDVFQILESALKYNNYTYKQIDKTETGAFRDKYITVIQLNNSYISVSWKDEKNPGFDILFYKFKDKELRNEIISTFREEIKIVSNLRLIGFELSIGVACIIYSTYYLLF